MDQASVSMLQHAVRGGDEIDSCTAYSKETSPDGSNYTWERGDISDRRGYPNYPKSKRKRDNTQATSQGYACPFRKYKPETYDLRAQNRACALTPFRDISRLKEHLYRRHKAPPYCVRCSLQFTDEEEVNKHLINDDCTVGRERQPPEGISDEIANKLRSRKKRSREETEEERWKHIYILLFPNVSTDNIPNPYFEPVDDAGSTRDSGDSRDLVQYEEHCRRELPRIFKRAMEIELVNGAGPIEEALQARLIDILHRCQDDLFRSYRGASTSSEAFVASQNSSLACSASRESVSISTIDSAMDDKNTPWDSSNVAYVLPDVHHDCTFSGQYESSTEVDGRYVNPFSEPALLGL